MIEAVLFDLGNTLMRDQAAQSRWMLNAAVRPLHDWLVGAGFRPPELRAYARRLRRGFLGAFLWAKFRRREVCVVDLLHRCHRRMSIVLSSEQMNQLGLQYLPMLRSFFSPFAESLPLLKSLHARGLKLGVVSNTMVPGFAMDEHLRGEELLPFLPVRVYSSEVGYKKPDRRIYHAALAGLAVEPSCTLFVGDCSTNDVRGPSRLGMKTVLFVPSGRNPARRVRPDHVIHCLSEIPRVLEANNRA